MSQALARECDEIARARSRHYRGVGHEFRTVWLNANLEPSRHARRKGMEGVPRTGRLHTPRHELTHVCQEKEVVVRHESDSI